MATVGLAAGGAYATGQTASDTSATVDQILNGGMVGSGGTFGYYLKIVDGPALLARNDGFVYDPASSFKTLLLATAAMQVASGADSLANPVTVYLYPHSRNANGNPAATTLCPDPADETSANLVSPAPTLDQVLSAMMGQSDNRATRGIELRYGRAAINALAQSLGMSNTAQKQILGCGDDNDQENFWTLDDASRLYEAIAKGSAGGSAATQIALTHMGTYAGLAGVIEPEADALGLVRTVTPYFAGDMHVYLKGGSNDICHGSCATDDEVTRDYAGLATIPLKTPTGVSTRSYAWGTFITNERMSCPSFPCPAADAAQTAATNSVAEVLRPAIRAALITWAAKTNIAGLTGRLKKIKRGRWTLTVSARLVTPYLVKPTKGAIIRFASRGHTLCSTATDEFGKARCSVTLRAIVPSVAVRFAGTSNLFPASATARTTRA